MVEKARTTTRAAATRKATNPKTATGPPVPATSRAKRGAEQAVVESGRTVSASSTASNLSTGTTVVNKGRKAPAPKKAPAKNMAISAAGKRVASKVEAPPAGRRVLRKRN